jgi:hypothetical protein
MRLPKLSTTHERAISGAGSRLIFVCGFISRLKFLGQRILRNGLHHNQKSTGKRQKAKGKKRRKEPERGAANSSLLIFAFCLLPFAF